MNARSQRGRPRDESIDRLALNATLDLLGNNGFEATTIQAVAAHANLHASAIYRRWPSRIALIETAITPTMAVSACPAEGDLEVDLRRFIRAYLSTWDSPAVRAAMPGLLAHYQSTGTARTPEQWLPVSLRPQFLDILLAAPAGTVDPNVDPNDVFDVLLGAILARILVPTVSNRNRPIERLVELAMRMVTPLPATQPTSNRRNR